MKRINNFTSQFLGMFVHERCINIGAFPLITHLCNLCIIFVKLFRKCKLFLSKKIRLYFIFVL